MRGAPDTFPFGGGLDTNSAALAVPPGALIAANNYEPLAEGYGRCEGYERYDGQEAPSAVAWYALDFDAGTNAIAEGDTVTGATSGATGVVAAAPQGLTGSWAGSDAAGTLILISVTGTFQDNESLEVSATASATANGTQVSEGAGSDDVRTTRFLLAMLYQRASVIGAVPGSGSVRGVAVHDDKVYAWRDNAGATALICHVATASGWSAMETLTKLPFTLGTAEVVIGDTVTGASSSASGVVVDVVISSGTWSGGDAAGYLALKTVSGTFTNGEFLQVSAANKATGGTPSTQTLGPGGRVRWISHNFYGASDLYRLYGCTGESNAFELIPGAGMVLISTGMADDRPARIFEINNHLGLCFPGGSIQFSGTLKPQVWSVIVGAGEIGFGTEINDVVQANETAVAFFGESKISILQGHDTSDFVLDTLTEEAGAIADTAQRIARTVYLDRRGMRSLDATQAFGNFKTGSLSERIEKYFRSKRKAGAMPTGSYVSKSKSQYRLVWDDGTGIAIYMGGKHPEAIPFSFVDTPHCFGQGELADGEAIFFGGSDGYVYRVDSGNSHDGTAITAYAMTGFNHFGSPSQFDRFFKVELELEAPALANISVTAQYNYGDSSQPISAQQDFDVAGGGGLWNIADWNEFNWSSPIEARAEAPVDGIGRNASFIFATTAGLAESPHILSAYAVHRSPRRIQR